MTIVKKRRDTIRNIISNSLVGNNVKIINHSDPNIRGKHGTVIKDTNNMLKLKEGETLVRISKETSLIEVEKDCVRYRIQGSLLVGSLKKRKSRKLRHW